MNSFRRTPTLETIKPQEERLASSSLLLKSLVANDQKMYAALQNFLLADPKRQILLLGEVDSLVANGNAARVKGNNQTARADYETAAKIEIYKQNKDSARSCL